LNDLPYRCCFDHGPDREIHHVSGDPAL
jgi:hypothetical protein